jgi:hypothetical protein
VAGVEAALSVLPAAATRPLGVEPWMQRPKEDGERKTIRERSGEDKVAPPTWLSRLLSRRTRGVLSMRRTETSVSPEVPQHFPYQIVRLWTNIFLSNY